MIRNYLIIAIRNLLKNKTHTFINVFGLTVGFAAVILILLYIKDELFYDKYDHATENIYRIYWQTDIPQTRTPYPMAQAMVRDFPEVETAVTLSPIWGPGLTRQIFSVRNLEKDVRYDERNVLAADSTFFNVFPFTLSKGDIKKVLHSPGKILLSESMARKYFGDEEPIGKHLAINNDRNILEIEGVFDDLPRQAHFHADMLVSYVHMKAHADPKSEYYEWKDFGHYNYIKVRPGTDVKKLEAQLSMTWLKKYMDISDEEIKNVIRHREGFHLQGIRDIHLHSHLLWELEPNGNIEYVYIMAAAAFFILIIATINFMNLTTARSAERAKEIGVRRTLGALKTHLTSQFMGESLILSMCSVVLAGFIAEIAIPVFNFISGKDLAANVLLSPGIILLILGGGVFIGILAGLYPSVVLSSIDPVKVLKGKFIRTKTGGGFARALVVFQFTIAIILISGTLVIYNQLNFIQHKNLGFTNDAIVLLPVRSREMRRDFESLQTELKKIPGVVNAGAASNVPGAQFNQNPVTTAEDKLHNFDASQIYVDPDFINTMGIELLKGRSFSKNTAMDSAAFIVNETAVKSFLLEDPIGKELIVEQDGEDSRGTIVGVVRDFHFQSLHQPIRPIIFHSRPYYNTVFVRLGTKDFAKTIAAIKEIWLRYEHNFLFEYSFMDETIQRQYQAENKMGIVFGIFSLIAVIISCLGLFGLVFLNYTQRRKEVSIRKVLGAPVYSLLLNLVKSYTMLILISILLAVPMAWAMMQLWLNNFKFKIIPGIGVFLLTGFGTLALAWLTIGYLTLRTAAINPIESLKEE